MPFVRVTSFPQTKESRAEIAQGITEVVHKATKIPKEYIWVYLTRCRRTVGQWAGRSSLKRSKNAVIDSLE